MRDCGGVEKEMKSLSQGYIMYRNSQNGMLVPKDSYTPWDLLISGNWNQQFQVSYMPLCEEETVLEMTEDHVLSRKNRKRKGSKLNRGEGE